MSKCCLATLLIPLGGRRQRRLGALCSIKDKEVPGETWWLDVKGNKTKLRGKWRYKYESTAGWGGTVFWRYNADFVKASGNKVYQ